MNKVVLMGRLTKDPELRQTRGEDPKSVASFSIAVARRYKKDETDFFDCTAWGKTADMIEKYWRKGMKALVAGRIQTDSYENKEGKKVKKIFVVVDDIEFCEKKETQEQAPAKEWTPAGNDELPWKF